MGSFKPYSGSGSASKIVQLRTQSGAVMSFDQYRKQLMKLSMPDSMRLSEIRRMLMVEARPFVHSARRIAYQGSEAIASKTTKTRSKGGSWFYNLYGSIGAWANKGQEKAYVVIGLRSQYKRGAYYAGWQLVGLAPAFAKDGRIFPGYNGKDFLEEASKDEAAIARAHKRLERFIYQRIAKYAA